MDDPDSSIDGSLADSLTSGTPEPALTFPDTPHSEFTPASETNFAGEHMEHAIGDALEMETSDYAKNSPLAAALDPRRYNGVNESSHHVGDNDDSEEEERELSYVSGDGEEEDLTPMCNKISKYLSSQGFPCVQLIRSDVDVETSMISTAVIESWAETVCHALEEIGDRVYRQNAAVSAVTSSAQKAEKGHDQLLKNIQQLEKQLAESQQREQALQLQYTILEESKSTSMKNSGADVTMMKRQLKSSEAQVQEYARQMRMKDVEMERYKQKLSAVVAKERDTNQRHKEVLQSIKSGNLRNLNVVRPYTSSSSGGAAAAARGTKQQQQRRHVSSNSANVSLLSTGSQSTVGSRAGSSIASMGSRAGSTGRSDSVSLSDVVGAFEFQRTELVSRNKELELQVQDLVQTLSDEQNRHQRQLEQNLLRGGAAGGMDDEEEQEEEDEFDDQEVYQRYRGAAGRGKATKPPLKRSATASKGNATANNDDDEDGGPGSVGRARMTPTAQKMYRKIEQQEEEIETLRRHLEVSQAIQTEKEESVTSIREKNLELHEEIEYLRLQLESRPTMRQWSQAQRDRELLEEKLHDLVLLRGESAEIAMWRKHLSTQDRIKVDKRNHELGLWLLDSLPKTTMKEVLQTVCRELDLSEISEIQPCLSKLKAVVKTIPRMERFIAQVCGFIYARHPTLGEIDGLKSVNTGPVGAVPILENADGGAGTGQQQSPQYTMEHVLPILRRWWYAAQRCVELDQFHTRTLQELHRRQEILARKSEQATGAIGPEDVGPHHPHHPQHLRTNFELSLLKQQWENVGKHQWTAQDPERVFEILRDLVDFQAEVMHHDQSLVYAEDYIRDKPEIMVNRVVSHIQYLFEIKTLSGVLPRLNQIYLFVEEMRTFLGSMRAILTPPRTGHSGTGARNAAAAVSNLMETDTGKGVAVSNAILLAEIQRRVHQTLPPGFVPPVGNVTPMPPMPTVAAAGIPE